MKGIFAFDITENDVINVYERLKDRYDLILTTTMEFDREFTVDSPLIVGKAHGQMIELYVCDDIFVLYVADSEQTMGTHWHPSNVDRAAKDITEFMDGKSDYKFYKYNQE